jgi:hypothetical protein
MENENWNYRAEIDREDVLFRIWLYQSEGNTTGVIDLMRKLGESYLDGNEAQITQDTYGILRLSPRGAGKDIPDKWHPIIEANLLTPIIISAINPYQQHVFGKGKLYRVADLKFNFVELDLKDVCIISPQEYNHCCGQLFENDLPDNYDIPKPPLKVFLCHSSKDKSFVRRLNFRLQENGIETWFDEEDILVGQSFISRMEEGVRESDFIAVVLTPNFLKGIWADRELQMALIHEVKAGRVKVLPILRKDCEIPGFLKSRSYADFKGNKFERGMETLMRSIFRLPRNEAS